MRFGYSEWSHLEDEWEAPPPQTTDWHLAADLGQAADFTAAAALERTCFPSTGAPPAYACRFLKRWPLGTSYVQIVDDLAALLAAPPLLGARLVLDATGVGKPVCDMAREKLGRDRVTAVVITAGSGESYDASSAAVRVPKKTLVFGLLALMQKGQLRIARALPEAAVLTRELQTFRVKVTLAGNESFEAWRERDHDDLVLALALGAWSARRYPAPSAHSGPVLVTPGREAQY